MATGDIIALAAVIGFILAGLAAVFSLVFVGNRMLLRHFSPLTRHLGFRHRISRNGKPVPETVEGDWEGIPARVHFRHVGRGNPGSLTFTLEHPLPVSTAVSVYPRRWYHRLAAGSGLLRHVAHGHGRFHQEAHVESEDDTLAERLVETPDFRDAVRSLLFHRNVSVTVEKTGVSFSMRRCSWRQRKRVLQFRSAQSILHGLASIVAALTNTEQSLPVATSDRRSETRESGNTPAAAGFALASHMGGGKATRVLILVSAFLLFAGPLFLWWGSRYSPLSWDLHLKGFTTGGIIALFSLVLTFRAIRGRSRALADFGLYFLWAVVGYPCFAAGLLVVINGLPDHGEGRVVSATVVEKQDAPKLRIAVPLTDGTISRHTVRVPRELHRHMHSGASLPVEVMPGILGEPWLKGPVAEP